MTVLELQKQYIRPGYVVEFIPYSWERTKGEAWIPFTGLPRDMAKAKTDEEWSHLLYTKQVVKYEVISDANEPTKVFSLTGRFKGFEYRITIAVWMHDAEE